MRILKQRVQSFLDQPLPDEVALNYQPDSMTEVFLRTYAAGGTFDEGLIRIGQICLGEIDDTIANINTEPAQAYFIECRKLLTEVLQEVM